MKFPYAEPLETGTAGFTLVDARIAWAFYDGDRTRSVPRWRQPDERDRAAPRRR
jgi:hypothetical protein